MGLDPYSFYCAGCLAACLVFAAPAEAAPLDEAPGSAASSDAAEEIIVSAFRRPRRAEEIGASVTIIDAATLERRQYAFLSDALADAPGVALARNGSFGGAASLRLRGGTSGQTLVVIDGVVVNDPAAPQGGFNFANLDLVDVDRIEILRGPQSLIYGADAIGGVVSITTKRDSNYPLTAFLEGGERGTVRGGATALLGDADHGARVTVSGIRTDGLSRAAAGEERDAFNSIAGSVAGWTALSPVWSLSANARFSASDAEIDGFPPPDFTLADSLETEETRDWSAAIRLAHEAGPIAGAITASIAALDRSNENEGVETFNGDGDRFSIDYIGEAALSERATLIGGGEFERYSANASGVDETAHNGAGFVALEVAATPDLTLSGGVRRDEFSDFAGASTARTGAAWRVWERGGARAVLRASWGQGFRAPTLFELNFDQFGIIPNPDLAPERARGFDVGMDVSTDAGHAIRATFFRQKVRDQIDFDFGGGGYFNIDRARSRGMEVEARLPLHDRLSVSSVYTLTDAIDETNGARVLRIPRHAASLFIDTTPTDRLMVSVSLRYNGEEADFPTPNDDFLRVDVNAAYAVTDHLELYGRVENATDTDYQDVSGYAEPGASAFGGVRVRL